MSTPYCTVARIPVPSPEAVKDHQEASNYSQLIVALLEQGCPLNRAEVARRFDEVGVAPADHALLMRHARALYNRAEWRAA